MFLQYLSLTNDIDYARFEDFRTFLSVFMSVVKVFVCKELWVNVPITNYITV